MTEAIGGDIAQQLGQALADPGEIVFSIQRSCAVAVAVLGERIDQVYV
jgi:limonene-1,2-epoxide hydrolase